MIEESGCVPLTRLPLTNGSGSGSRRPQSIKIRIRNTGHNRQFRIRIGEKCLDPRTLMKRFWVVSIVQYMLEVLRRVEANYHLRGKSSGGAAAAARSLEELVWSCPALAPLPLTADACLPVRDRQPTDTSITSLEIRNSYSPSMPVIIGTCHICAPHAWDTWDTWWLVSKTPSRGVVDTSVDPLWSAIRHSCWFLSPKYRLPPGCNFSVLFSFTVLFSFLLPFSLSISFFPSLCSMHTGSHLANSLLCRQLL